jgi:formate-dependent nitrite reductase cytochrome c552 subunit
MMTSHWLSMLGLFLVVTALVAWLVILPIQGRGGPNPYIGIVVFVVVPILFVAGLLLVPLGIYLARRRIHHSLGGEATLEPGVAWRRLGLFFGVTALVNALVVSLVTYRAVHQMETVQFCGQTCHVMTPQARAHPVSAHARLACVECHVGEGARGWFESKAAGTRQLFEVAFDSYPRPVPSPLASGRLVPTRETCEHCHNPEQFAPARLRVISRFAEEEANTETQTVLTMMVGGSRYGGIHGKHYGPGVEIRFAATDAEREKIPWVEYRNTNTGETRVYQTDAGGSISSAPKILMQCVDCHNRPAHTFSPPDRALDAAFAVGTLPTTLPYLKKTGMEALKASYASSEEAARRIPQAIEGYYKQSHPEIYASRAADVQSAGRHVAEIYSRNVFPDLKVTWGTYRNNIGHDTSPGCFRCHDEQHATSEGKTITMDCAACHEAIAVEEASPDVLKTLGLAERMSALRKK